MATKLFLNNFLGLIIQTNLVKLHAVICMEFSKSVSFEEKKIEQRSVVLPFTFIQNNMLNMCISVSNSY